MADDTTPNQGQSESLASSEDTSLSYRASDAITRPEGEGAANAVARTPPTAAKIALWLMVAIVVAFVLAIFISTIVMGDSYWGAFVVGYFGLVPGLIAWTFAAGAGAIGFVQSIRRHSGRGLWMSLAPYVVVFGIVILTHG
jgi:hypothetical protein